MTNQSYADIFKAETKINVFCPIKDKETEMIRNAEGAYVFEIDHWTMAKRWLFLGAESGTFYASKRDLTISATESLNKCIKENGQKFVEMIKDYSVSGKVANQDALIYALALTVVKGNDEAKRVALKELPNICRFATDLFTFVEFLTTLNGNRWSRSRRRAIANWYLDRNADEMAYQVVKYASRVVTEGNSKSKWSHADLIKLSHPKPVLENQSQVLRFALGKIDPQETENNIIMAKERIFELAKNIDNKKMKEIIDIIINTNMPHECIPNTIKDRPELWKALAPIMPLGALIRNLPKMTAVECITQFSETSNVVSERLMNEQQLKKARIHPMTILKAMKAYQIGRNRNMTWTPCMKVVDALDEAFYLSFQNVEKTNKNILIGWDTSGSMHYQNVLGIEALNATEAAGAMALSLLASAPNSRVVMFNNKVKEVTMSPKQRLTDAIDIARNFGGATNLSLPIRYAMNNNIKVDAFVIFTDNETNMYDIHPCQLLEEYREKMKTKAKMVVVALTGTKGSIADQKDINTLDVVGLSTETPAIITNFINGLLE